MKRLILLAALVSGCTSIAPMTAMQLSRVSPLTANPADFAVKMDLPDGIDVRPGTAQLSISVERNGSDHGGKLHAAAGRVRFCHEPR